MKTKLTLLALLISMVAFAQNGINYKAVIKDDLGNVVASQSVDVQFSILQGAAQTNVYTETHASSTDVNGIMMVNIGEGATSDVFTDIDWASADHFLKVQIDTGSGFVDMGTTQFMHVPYAIQAGKAANVSGLEAIDEGHGIGWRLIGSDPSNYGNIGFRSTDLSYSNINSATYGATGTNAVAMGVRTSANGDSSVALGSDSQASEDFSIAIGAGAEATEQSAVSIGGGTMASGVSSTAMGSFTVASGTYSTAMGNNSLASGIGSFSMGEGSEATNEVAIAMGKNSTASGAFSIALGLGTLASNVHSISIGLESNASGFASLSFGPYTQSTGFRSLAIGNSNIASGEKAMALGTNTTAQSQSEFVVGKYNIPSGNSESWILTDPLFTVGNGVSSVSRSNALTVLKNGNLGLGTSQPTVALQFSSSSGNDASLNDGTGYMVLGSENGTNLVFDNNEIMARNNGNTSELLLQHDGGAVRVGGSVVHSSDERLKQNIETIQYGLNEVLQLQPKQYFWKNRDDQAYKSLGLIAQEVQPIIQNIVLEADDELKTLSVSYTELIPVLIKAIQEQQKIIEVQNETINKQDKTNTDQSKILEALMARVVILEGRNSN